MRLLAMGVYTIKARLKSPYDPLITDLMTKLFLIDKIFITSKSLSNPKHYPKVFKNPIFNLDNLTITFPHQKAKPRRSGATHLQQSIHFQDLC